MSKATDEWEARRARKREVESQTPRVFKIDDCGCRTIEATPEWQAWWSVERPTGKRFEMCDECSNEQVGAEARSWDSWRDRNGI